MSLNRLGYNANPETSEAYCNKSLFLAHAQSMQLDGSLASYSYGPWSMWPLHSHEEVPGGSHEMF